MHNNSLYPVFIDLQGKRVLVVGGGTIASRKVAALLNSGAVIIVVAREVCQSMQMLADSGKIELFIQDYESSFLDNVWMVIAATNNTELNSEIFRHAESMKILCNVVDVPSMCRFHVPAVVRRGDLQVAVSTAGKSPTVARDIKKRISRQFGVEYKHRLNVLGAIRSRLKEMFPDNPELRMKFNKKIAYEEGLDNLSIDDQLAIDVFIKNNL